MIARRSPCFARVFCLALILTFACARAALAEDPKGESLPAAGIDGAWQGTLKVGPIELRIVFNFTKGDDGALAATMDSPDQGANGIPVDSVTVEEGTVRLSQKALQASFEGKLNDDQSEIVGEWKQGGGALPLTVKRLEKAPDYNRPQDPKPPLPYLEEEVSYENTAANLKLAGTLTLPMSTEPVPAVLLISGSGSQDRNETIFGHKPFLVLADALTRRGIAILRVDDRGVGGSTGDGSQSTIEDHAGDVLAGVAYLKTRPEIDPRKIGLAGHSEGGVIAPLAASQSDDVAFIVMLAGTGVNGEEILYRQGELIARTMGATDEQIAKNVEGQRRIFSLIKSDDTPEALEAKLQKLLDDQLAAQLPAGTGEAAKAAARMQADGQIKAVQSPWFRHFLVYDPKLALAKVKCPVLAINGEKDLQVDPRQNLPPIEQALKEAGNPDVTIRELLGLNHLFQTSQTGSIGEYGKIDETFAPSALELIGDWILEHTTPKPEK